MLRTFCRRTAALALKRDIYVKPASCCHSWSAPDESPEQFKFVERLIPKGVVPEVPGHGQYPTPSGWVPATAKLGEHPYCVRRTRYNQLPVYMEIRDGGTRQLTLIRLVEGDIWELEKDLKKYLEDREGVTVYTAVDELCCKIRVRGPKLRAVSDFLLEKGF